MNAFRPNHLINEKSPYLQQHAHNPVDWWPWGPEALAAAKTQDKPIFLSIGYSTCHWCHVMAHESFENPEIADLMNDRFINIKVDREERPDIDAIYMSAVQALTGSGGWPMSVWLTPDLKPFYGGTYFPPEDRYGRPGFPTVILQLGEIFEKERARVSDASNEITQAIGRAASAAFRQKPALPPATSTMNIAFTSLEAGFDSSRGGFSPAPKFPMPVYLDFLLYYHGRTGNMKALEMSAFTVRQMINGGIYDQLGGGFSRYSTDERWLVPHFEKMLYDNAQLLRVCAQLAVATGDAIFRRAALETAMYLNRDLRHPDGAYYSAEDADSEGKEGTFYLWTMAELTRVLGDDAKLAAAAYGVTVDGNFMDPHTREEGMNVLSAAKGSTLAPEKLDSIRQRLFEHRARRIRPHRDEKILTEWNGLAISAFARAGFLLEEPSLGIDAARAAAFIEEKLFDAATGRLYRRWCDGDRAVDAQQADYAMLVEGLLDLFETVGDARWLNFALRLQEIQDRRFFDTAGGGYFMNDAAPDLLIRVKEDGDNVIPSGSSVAAMNGLRLTALTGKPEFREKAVATLNGFVASLTDRPFTVSKMIPALDWEESGHVQVVIVGRKRDASTSALSAVLRSRATSPRQMILIEPERQAEIGALLPHVAAMTAANGHAAAYVCKNFSCREPVADAAALGRLLAASV